MCNISYLPIELWSNEKSYIFPFEGTSLNSVALNPLEKYFWDKIELES